MYQTGRFAGPLVAVAVLLLAGPRGEAADPPLGGLSPEDRKDFYHLAEGSELFPLDWLRAMNSAKTGKPFLDDLGRFGLIDDPDGPVISAKEGWRLPVGVTRATPRGSATEMIGVNCAACHVAELRLKGAVVRVDGAPSLFDIQGFYEEMFQSAAVTLSNPTRLVPFLKTLQANGPRDPVTKLLVGLLPFLTGEPGAGDGGFEKLLLNRLRETVGGRSAGPEAAMAAAVLAAKDSAERMLALAKLAAARAEAVKEEIEFLEKLPAFAAKLEIHPEALPLLLGRITFLKKLRNQDAHDGPAPRAGFGRVDAFTSARNFLFSAVEARSTKAPVRYPILWGLGDRWLHWDGNTRSIMERNVGQAMGLGGVADPKTLSSTLIPGNLHKLEVVVRKLKAPAWPAAFGKLDPTTAAYKKGAEVYAEHCAACHDCQKPGEFGRQVPEGGVVYNVGTDPQRTKSFGEPLADKTPFATAVGVIQKKLKKKAFADNQLKLEEEFGVGFEAKFDQPEADIRWLTTGGYVARPLAGAWATAPYLHNGSVPTLADLLEPAEKRPVVFPVGHREYDPERVGFVSRFDDVPADQRAAFFVFDTRLAGNRNTGHEFGTKLTPDEKQALLLYLKGKSD